MSHPIHPNHHAGHAYRHALMQYAYWHNYYPYQYYPWSAYNSGLYGSYQPYYSQPYSSGSYGGGYGYSSPYSYGSYGYSDPYSSGSYASSPASSSASYAGATAAGSTPAYAPKEAPAKKANNLAAFGIPSEDGKVLWPLALRLMAPEQKRTLLDDLDSLLQAATTQAAAGNKANPVIVKEALRSVDTLQQWLRKNRDTMAEGTYNEGTAFLRKLDRTLDAMLK